MAKYIPRYLLRQTTALTTPRKDKTESSLNESSEVERQIMATNPVLEAFDNAKTTRNDNWSEFRKVYSGA